MHKNYYFLATALTPLKFNVLPEMDFEELTWLMQQNLSAQDLEYTRVVRRYYDILNIRSFWKEEPLDPYGNLDEVDLEDALLTREGLPEYVYDYLDMYETPELQLQNFSALVESYFREESKNAVGLLKEYLEFERQLRLTLLGLRAKQLNRDLVTELQFEDLEDDSVAQILAQKDAKAFVPPEGFQDLQPIFEAHLNDPLGLHRALSEYQFKKLESLAGVDLFSLDRILGYMLRLMIVEKWMGLDKEVGLNVLAKCY